MDMAPTQPPTKSMVISNWNSITKPWRWPTAASTSAEHLKFKFGTPPKLAENGTAMQIKAPEDCSTIEPTCQDNYR